MGEKSPEVGLKGGEVRRARNFLVNPPPCRSMLCPQTLFGFASECCLWLLASNRHSMQTSRVVWVQGRRFPWMMLSQLFLLPFRHFRRLSCYWRLTKTSIQRCSLTCPVVVAGCKALWLESAIGSTFFAPFRHVQSLTVRLNTRLCRHCPRAESKYLIK